MMDWLSILKTTAYYVLLPFTTIITTTFNVLLTIFAPLIHLGHYSLHGLFLPVTFLGRFETLYIYFGVAALCGLLAGSVLHLSSRILTSVLDLQSSPQESGRTAASVRAAREKRKLEEAWQSATPLESSREKSRFGDDSLKKEYAEFLEKDRGKRLENQGLLSQTILEEDDSEDSF